jgi:transcriptional regulator with XRE-family HTH domain
MYEIFERLMKAKGFTAYKVSIETGVAQSTLSDWKNGKSKPKQDKLQRIADLFGVSLEYLMTGTEKVFPEFEAEHLELIKLYSKLNEEQKRTVLVFLRSLAPLD